MRQFMSFVCFAAALAIVLFASPWSFRSGAVGLFGGTITPIYPMPQSPIHPLNDDALTVEDLLEKVAARYADAASYHDEGVVEVVMRDSGWTGDHASWKPFRIQFIRPDHFRFEFESFDHPTAGGFGHELSYIVWRNPEEMRSWWTVDPSVREHETLYNALAGPTGISSGAAVTIPRMLMPSKTHGQMFNLRQPVLVGKQEVDGRLCYRIEDKQPFITRNVVVWIDVETFLVRRTFSVMGVEENVKAETMTVYQPHMDVEISKTRFAFSPPKADGPIKAIGLFDRSFGTDPVE